LVKDIIEVQLDVAVSLRGGEDDPRETTNNVGEGQHDVVEIPHHWWSYCGLRQNTELK